MLAGCSPPFRGTYQIVSSPWGPFAFMNAISGFACVGLMSPIGSSRPLVFGRICPVRFHSSFRVVAVSPGVARPMFIVSAAGTFGLNLV